MAGTRELVNHREDYKLRDRIGYPGDKEDILLEVPAGSVAVWSSRDFNRSGSNTSPNIPRIHLPHDSPGPMKETDGTHRAFAGTFLVGGARRAPPRFQHGQPLIEPIISPFTKYFWRKG